MTQNEALVWIAEVFEEPVENVQPSTPRDAIAMWDSLGVLALMAALDEQLDISIDSDEVTAIESVDHILDVLRRHDKIATP